MSAGEIFKLNKLLARNGENLIKKVMF